jgi:hypothetical protein
MNSLGLIAHLRSRGFANPIILLSGAAETHILTPENTGADVVIQKSGNDTANLVLHAKRLLAPKKPAAGLPDKRDPRNESAPYDVFVSHSDRDLDLAARVADFVRSTGAQVTDWFLEPDKQGISEIAEKLRRSNEMIVLVTTHSATNPWLPWEIGLAAGLGKRITPIVDGIDSRELPPPLNDAQAVSAAEIEQFRQRLTTRIASYAKARPTAAIRESKLA